MLLYRSPATDAMWAGLQADPSDAPDRWDEPEDVGASVGVVALRPGQVYQPGASGAWLAGATGPVTAGEPMVFYRPVAAVPVRRRRNGAVLAAGWLPEHVRLGVLEALLPAGLVDWLVRQVSGVRETQRRRVMNAALVVRFVLALVLWPEADYVEVMRRLVGDLPALPWQRPWQVPSSRVISQWRTRVPATLFEQLFWAVAGPLAGAREPGLYVNGLLVRALDGFMVDLPATEANRAYFTHAKGKRSTGPFPQLRAVLLVACATRGALAAAVDRPRHGEHGLTRRLVKTHPEAFGPGRLVIMDRNYPGFKLIHAIRTQGATCSSASRPGSSSRSTTCYPTGPGWASSPTAAAEPPWCCGWSSTTSPSPAKAGCPRRSPWPPACSTPPRGPVADLKPRAGRSRTRRGGGRVLDLPAEQAACGRGSRPGHNRQQPRR